MLQFHKCTYGVPALNMVAHMPTRFLAADSISRSRTSSSASWLRSNCSSRTGNSNWAQLRNLHAQTAVWLSTLTFSALQNNTQTCTCTRILQQRESAHVRSHLHTLTHLMTRHFHSGISGGIPYCHTASALHSGRRATVAFRKLALGLVLHHSPLTEHLPSRWQLRRGGWAECRQ